MGERGSQTHLLPQVVTYIRVFVSVWISAIGDPTSHPALKLDDIGVVGVT